MVDRRNIWQLYVEVAALAMILLSRLSRDVLDLPHFALARGLFCFDTCAVRAVRPITAVTHET